MSQIHVNQIQGYLDKTFTDRIDMTDAPPDASQARNLFLTRALAAFAIGQLAGLEPQGAAATVTDGSGDNGVDALHYDETTRTLYVVQSKWCGDGNLTFGTGDAHKFNQGMADLFDNDLSKFNAKTQAKSQMVLNAMYAEGARSVMVLVHTGQHDLHTEPHAIISTFIDDSNDTGNPDPSSDLVSFRQLKQSDVYNFISRGTQGDPIDLEVMIYDWGSIANPYAVYGQVVAGDVAGWWKAFYPRIVEKNIRMFLGAGTEVNKQLQTTLLTNPERFWHFNNGITVICKSITKKGLGGGNRDSGVFDCHDALIVNGAQTAGSITDAHAKDAAAVDKARVPIRFIQVGDVRSSELAESITRATNTQNRINSQDFVALDPVQEAIRTQLNIEGIEYVYKSSEVMRREKARSFDLYEATVALACASSDLGHSTQAKREISRLWDDPTKAPYKALFNPAVTGTRVWNCVQVLRMIDRGLRKRQWSYSGRNRGFLIHGNRFLAHCVFRQIDPRVLNGDDTIPGGFETTVESALDDMVKKTMRAANALHPGSYLATLFKNQSKLSEIKGYMDSQIGGGN